MRQSKVLAKIQSGKIARVCFLGHYLPYFPRHAAHFGYDGVWVDGEHRAFDPREAQALIAFHHLADIDCIWRPPTVEKTGLYRFLEDGATGLMIPFVSTPEQALEIVRAVKFPPLGNRGLDGTGFDTDYAVRLTPSYAQDMNKKTYLVVQIETPEAVSKADAIAAVPGVDILFIGPSDLALRLGCEPDARDPRLMQAQERISLAAKRHKKAWGQLVASVEEVRTIKELGGQFIAFGSEFRAIRSHLQDASAQLDAVLGSDSERL